MSTLTGTGTLVRLVLRLDRVRIPVWILGITGIVLASAQAVGRAYQTPEQIRAYADTMGTSPAAIAMAGPPFALDTVGGILVYETSVTALVAVALMAVFLVVRHTRTEEETGRTEVLGSTVVGRHAPLAAAVLVVSAACALVGLGVATALLSTDAGASGSLVFGAAVAAFGIVFAAVAGVTAQLTAHARSATGIATALLGLSFLVRALGDIGDGTLSWLSPMGWSQQVAAFADDRLWPLLLSAGLVAALLAVAAVLLSHRDLGAGMLPQRVRPAHAGRRLAGPVGLALRLQRGSLLGWTVGVLVAGAAFGAFSREVQQMVDSNPTFADYFSAAGGGVSLVDSFFATALLVISLLAAGFAASSVLQLRAEEAAGRAEPLLATRLSRTRWFLGTVAVTVAGSVVVVAAGGLGIGLAHGLVEDDPSAVPRMVGSALAYVPAVLVVAAVVAALVGWLPRRAVALGWTVVALCFVVGWLGDVLELPGWVMDGSPFTHTPALPGEELTPAPLLVLLAVAAVGTVTGAAGLRRRDIG
jgi:ABC-2 type transport system permease protein